MEGVVRGDEIMEEKVEKGIGKVKAKVGLGLSGITLKRQSQTYKGRLDVLG
jgi:hypothetical protein